MQHDTHCQHVIYTISLSKDLENATVSACLLLGLFTNIVVRWPGSCHDIHIFHTSLIAHQLQGTGLDYGVLLGNSGYACSPFLMTPYQDPVTRKQKQFNRAQKVTHCLIERTFGILKKRFNVLHQEIRMSPERACTIIAAIKMREPDLDEENVVADEQAYDMKEQYHGPENGFGVRNHITEHFLKKNTILELFYSEVVNMLYSNASWVDILIFKDLTCV